ncbi:MAG: 4Fe-4S dicluster domain-containing protein [Candidatus Omnitrophica bacterium]|nr:4Fe-4S dicluster domain-containing protein [Candidatus Omnitrophota bacterium]
MHTTYYIQTAVLGGFIHKLKSSFRVFVPVEKPQERQKEKDYAYKELNGAEDICFNPYRAVEPFKSFFTYPQESVCSYFDQDQPIGAANVVVFGVKSCDIAGHRVQDFVFLEGVEVDASYRLRRENTIIISGDCTDFKQVCHCLAWEILPHPTIGFDLNLSPLNDGYLVDVGSAKGDKLIQQYKDCFAPARETQISARKAKRENLIDRLKRHLLPQNLVSPKVVQGLVKEGYGLDTWKEFMRTCVECGGCNFICDTCHCFLLSDKKEGAINKKVRAWDSCLYANYARVAGGANPLRTRAQRLRNRFMKKFDFFVDNLGMPACCGCGRCIEVCPGKIDIREVLKDLAKRLNK